MLHREDLLLLRTKTSAYVTEKPPENRTRKTINPEFLRLNTNNEMTYNRKDLKQDEKKTLT